MGTYRNNLSRMSSTDRSCVRPWTSTAVTPKRREDEQQTRGRTCDVKDTPRIGVARSELYGSSSIKEILRNTCCPRVSVCRRSSGRALRDVSELVELLLQVAKADLWRLDNNFFSLMHSPSFSYLSERTGRSRYLHLGRLRQK